MDRKLFTALDVKDLPHYSRADLAVAALLDEVDDLIGTVDFTDPQPTAASLGLADPRELSNEAVSLADTLTVMAHAAEVGDVATLQDLAVAAGRAEWMAAQIVALVELGGVR